MVMKHVHHFRAMTQVEQVNIQGIHEVPVSDAGQEPNQNFVDEFESQTASKETMILHEEVKH
jgi:hypothetical protein